MTTDINSMRAVALGLSTALLSLAVAEIQPAQASEVFAFQCLKAGDQAVIALGNMPRPVGGVAMNPGTLEPLEASGMFPFAVVRSKLGGANPQRRCSTIATRLTNLALATNSASPLGIINLTNYFVGGRINGTPVIAVDQLSYGDVLGTLPMAMDPKAALTIIDRRIRLISAGNAIAEAVQSGDIIVFEAVEVIVD
jgi:hypothetical protein